MRVIAYTRVSTEEQGDSRAGLEAQQASIDAEVDRRGWDLIETYTDIATGKTLRKRDNLGAALRALAAGEAEALVTAKLDRLSRSVLDFAGIMETAAKEGWSINVLDLGVDTTTPNGELVANIMISMAQWERRIIGERTKSALAAVRARGTHVGRKRGVDDETVRLIEILREDGRSYAQIATRLADAGVDTGQGGKWHPATVRKILMRGVPA